MRALTTKNIYDKKHETFQLSGIWADVFGNMSSTGVMIIYGAEKNGKTWFALLLAKMFAGYERVIYVSAEEGTDIEFVENIRRAGIKSSDDILWYEYMPLIELEEKLKKRKSPRIIFIDNATVYDEEFKNGEFLKFKNRHPDKYIVVVAHEERKEPYPACARAIRRFAKIIIQVKGLTCFISGRCPGGVVTINEEKAQLYHGNEIVNN